MTRVGAARSRLLSTWTKVALSDNSENATWEKQDQGRYISLADPHLVFLDYAW